MCHILETVSINDQLQWFTEICAVVGESIFFMNLSSLLVDDAVITEASYNQSDVLRTAAVALKFKVMTVVLHENHNKTKLSFHLKGNRGDETSVFEVGHGPEKWHKTLNTSADGSPGINEFHIFEKFSLYIFWIKFQ